MASLLVASFHNRPQLLHFDPDNATLSLETLETPEFVDYTWISAHPKRKNLFYALQRYSDAPGTLSIIRLIPSSVSRRPRLEISKSYPSHGMDPCHLGISAKADTLAIANYDTSTVTVYSLRQDGMVDDDTEPAVYDLSKLDFTTGPNRERQDGSHPHGCFYAPGLQCYLVPDLGADKLRLIGKDVTLPCEAGAGPRHAVIDAEANIAYIVNELNNTVTIHDLSTTDLPIASYSVLPSDVKAHGQGMCASAINMTPDKRFIYVTNRLESHPKGDAIVCFRVASDGRSLERKGEWRTGLDHPRAAEIFEHRGTTYYVVGSRTERGAVVYRIGKDEGDLSEVARNADVAFPTGFVVIQE